MKPGASGPIMVLFAKPPRLGEVKTRIAAEMGEARALELYTAFLRDSIDLLRRVSGRGVRPAIAWAGGAPSDLGESLEGIEILEQDGEDLGQRMLNCMALLLARGHDRVAIMGADTPSLPPEHLFRAFEVLRDRDLVIGPSADGGYYLIGARAVVPEIFRGIPWGTDRVLPETLRILKIFGLPRVLLPVWPDVDTIEDLQRLRSDLSPLPAGDPTARHTRAALGGG